MLQHTAYRCGTRNDLGFWHFGRDSICNGDSKSLGDSLFEYCVEKACCAPLEQAAAAFVGLGVLLTASEDVSSACLQSKSAWSTIISSRRNYRLLTA